MFFFEMCLNIQVARISSRNVILKKTDCNCFSWLYYRKQQQDLILKLVYFYISKQEINFPEKMSVNKTSQAHKSGNAFL